MTIEQEKLIEDYKYLAFKISSKYRNRGIEYEDLKQSALEGLIIASKKFDPSKNISFMTFSFRVIHNHIFKEFRTLAKSPRTSSLNKKISEDNDQEIESLLEDPTDKYNELIERMADRSLLKDAFLELSEDERIMIYLYYYQKKTQKEIAKELNLSQSFISRKINKIIKKMRNYFLVHGGI